MRHCDDCGAAVPGLFSRLYSWLRWRRSKFYVAPDEISAIVARRALENLRNNMETASALNRDFEPSRETKIGETVFVRKPAVFKVQQ